jgi:hypothetical protein
MTNPAPEAPRVKLTPQADPAGALLGEDDQKNSLGVPGKADASMAGS